MAVAAPQLGLAARWHVVGPRRAAGFKESVERREALPGEPGDARPLLQLGHAGHRRVAERKVRASIGPSAYSVAMN